MADYYWKGDTDSDATNAGNWVTASEGSTKHTTLPVDGDSVYFDATSESYNNCDLSAFSSSPHSGYFPSNSSHKLANFEIKDTFRSRVIETTAALTINLSGQLIIDEEKRLAISAATTFAFNSAPNITTYNSAGSATTKAFVRFINAETSFADDASRSNTTFNFGSQNFSMIDGIYPKITGTGNLQAKSVFSDASRALHNTYGSVDMLDINGIGVTSGDYDIYDYDKQFYFEGALTAIADTFKFGHTTARFKANSAGAKLPVNGERNSNAYGNDTNKTFYTDYHKVVIENGGSSNYWIINAGLTLDCNELVINDGGRLYGPSSGTRAATIKSVKRPTVRGDWNFRQITDGIYESVNDASNTSVYEGGTGRQTLTDNAILYGQGMDQVGLDTDFTYDPTEKFLEVEKIKSHIVIQVKNETGSTIPKGAAVYVDDNDTTPLVALACGDTASKMPAIGLVMEQIADNNTGYTAVNGIITISSSQIDDTLSDPADIGKILYVSATNPGKLTITKPTSGSHLIQNVGNIANISGGNVKVTISNIGRTNDIPNATITTNSADADYVYIDDGNVWKKITPANLGIGGGSDTNTFVIVGEESDDYITSSATAGNANGYQFSYGNGAQNTTKSSTGSDFGVMIPVACTLSRLDFTFGNIGSEDNTSNQTITVYKNAASTTTTVTFNCNGSGGNAFTKSFSSLSGDGLSYSAGDTFNLRTTGLSGFIVTQIGPARMTAYFTVA